MKYLYYDLGEQRQDSRVVAHLHGSAANVILVDPLNFDRYRFGQPFQYAGGFHTRTPARVRIPEDAIGTSSSTAADTGTTSTLRPSRYWRRTSQ